MRNVFRFTVVACGLFVLLTAGAMLVYPSGHVRHADLNGYAFFLDSLSDLGQTRTLTGRSNLPSMVLFCAALGLVAIALPAFFAAYAALFARGSGARIAALAGAAAAFIAGLSFGGVAATPANLFQAAHNFFVFWAFRAFLAAIVCAAVAAFLSRSLPRSVGVVFAAFGLLLTGYIFVTVTRHIPGDPTGHAFGATAQKLIVYTSILTIMLQAAILAREYPRRAQRVLK